MSYDHNVFSRRGLKELAGSLKIAAYGNKADIAARIELHSADSAAMLKTLFDKCMAEKRQKKIRTDKDTMLSSTRLPTDWLTDYGMKFCKEDVRDGKRVYVYIKKSKSLAASKTIVKGGERSSGTSGKTGKTTTARAIKFDFTTFTSRLKAAVDDRALVNALLAKFFLGVKAEVILKLSDKKAYDHLANIMCYEEADS